MWLENVKWQEIVIRPSLFHLIFCLDESSKLQLTSFGGNCNIGINIQKFTFVFSKMWWGFKLFGITTMLCWIWYLNRTCRTIKYNIKTQKEKSGLRRKVLPVQGSVCASWQYPRPQDPPVMSWDPYLLFGCRGKEMNKELYKISSDV